MTADRLATAVEAIYGAALNPPGWPDALQTIADVFEDVGAVLVFERDDGGFGVIESASLSPMIREFTNSFHGEDLRAIRARERGLYVNRDAVTDRDLVTPDEMEMHPQYKLLMNYGLKFCAAASVSPVPHLAAAISVQRLAAKPPYSDSELATLTKLCHHAEASLRLSIRLLSAELSNVGLRDALSRLGVGVFAIDSLSRVVFLNKAAETSLGDGIKIQNRRLEISSRASRKAIEQAIAGALMATPEDLLAAPHAMLIQRENTSRPLTIYVLPVVNTSAWTRWLTQARVILLVVDPRPGDPPDPTTVRDLLGITLGEARVASLVGSGLSPREAGLKIGVTEESARTVLKRVYAKIGVSKQSELAALLTKLVLK